MFISDDLGPQYLIMYQFHSRNNRRESNNEFLRMSWRYFSRRDGNGQITHLTCTYDAYTWRRVLGSAVGPATEALQAENKSLVRSNAHRRPEVK